MTGSRQKSETKQVGNGANLQLASSQASNPAATPATDFNLSKRLVTRNRKGQDSLLSNPRIPAIQRQRLIIQMGRRHGNRHLQRVMDRIQTRTNRKRITSHAATINREYDPLNPQTPNLAGEGQIPFDLLNTPNYETMSNDELEHRRYMIETTLMQVQQSSPETQSLEEQATQIGQVLGERQVERRIREELERFLHQFSNITVTVSWGEDTGTQSVMRSEEVAVHPPYFMNVMNRATAHPRTVQRYDAARSHRRAADRATRNLLNEISRRESRGGMGAARARVGKSNPEDIRRILQTALDRNLIQGGAGRDHPNSEDLRNWLIRYGIGVDCSAFVSQALNQVTAEIGGRPLTARERLNRGSGGLRGGTRSFARVSDPNQLQAGDTMHIRGHIRIVTGVRREVDGSRVFSTAESRSGGQADVGPDSAEWRYHEGQLQMRRSSSDAWTNSTETPTYGRYRRLQSARESAVEQAAGSTSP